MSFAWPLALVALLAVPALLALRWWALRGRRRNTVRISNVTLVRAAVPASSTWRRRVPVGLFTAGLVVLGVAAARPTASQEVPSSAATILLAIDTSRSMCSTDVSPNRLGAAKQAATDFVDAQGEGRRVGLVAFAGFAALVVEPTTEHDDVISAIDALTASRGTAIGQAILASIDAIAEVTPAVAPSGVESVPDAPEDGDVGDYRPETIVVLTDGSNRDGVDPVTAAEQAAARRLRVHTIGFGTTDPAVSICDADEIDADSLDGDDDFGGGWNSDGGGPSGGWSGPSREIDEETLVEVAEVTGGEYFRAEDADELTGILLDLDSTVVMQREDVEVAYLLVLPGVLLIVAGLSLSLWWGRMRRPDRES